MPYRFPIYCHCVFASSCFLHRVVEAVRQVEVGELLCHSLKDAPDSTLLRFAISSTEVRGEDQGVGRVVSHTRKCHLCPSLV